ncbi:MAG: Tol-Pal system beta propeller repeat protein TolB [Paracoccaceae bacterium]
MSRFQTIIALLLALVAAPLAAQERPVIEIDISGGVIEPMNIALASFVPETGDAGDLATNIASVITSDLTGTGLFREVPTSAHIGRVDSINATIEFADWRAINAQILVIGSVAAGASGELTVKFRLFDVVTQRPIGDGVQLAGSQAQWRRMAHKLADTIYTRLTGQGGYFDSRVVFVAESGPKDARLKRLAVMDYDGANLQFLTDSSAIVLAPRFAPNSRDVLYTSYENGAPQVFLLNVDSGQRQVLLADALNMTFAPRYAPDGLSVVMSMEQNGNTDLYTVDLASRQATRLTSDGSIETGPSYSPDGSLIAFESDRSGGQQLYIMPANGGAATRISNGEGRYATPVWSPRGDLIAFTKIMNGRFHIGVMNTDGTGERLLTESFLDEAPTWSPNGRVLMFFRETSGANGAPQIYSVDLSGRTLRMVPTAGNFASDPAWSGLLR